MPDLKAIYAHQAEQYEQLVAREDYQGNILKTLQNICPLDGLEVVELGAGTGRLSCLMAPHVKSLRLFDQSQAMLDVAAARLKGGGWQHWQTQAADHLHIPVPDASADLSISGWSLCYAALDHPENWRAALDQALHEMGRVLRPGGSIVILETKGTGYETPHPPATLQHYLDGLDDSGFEFTWIRTDYRFASLDEAVELIGFFFGSELAQQTRQNAWQVLPECTGVWWKRVG